MTQKTPTVSVITPVYNGAKYIGETIASVLAQTFTDFEMIIIDDGSTDATADVVQRYLRQNPEKIRYIHQSNGGPAKARNHGIREAQGEFIAFLDADDLWLPGRLEKSMNHIAEHKDIALSHAKTFWIDENGKNFPGPPRDTRYLNGHIFRHLIKRKAHVSCLTVTLRKDCLSETGLFDESPECFAVEDRDLWLRITKKFKAGFLDQELGYYRVLPLSISRDSEKMIARKKYVIEKNCPGAADFLTRRRAMAEVYRETADEFLESKNFAKARNYYATSLRHFPFQIWGWVNLLKTLRG